MTVSTDILGRKPIMKPRQEPQDETPDADWKGEKFITNRTYQRMGLKFTLANAARAARRKGQK